MSNATVQAHAQTLALGLDVVHEPAANGKEIGQTCANRTSYACATRTNCPEYPQMAWAPGATLGPYANPCSCVQEEVKDEVKDEDEWEYVKVEVEIPCNSQPKHFAKAHRPIRFS